MCENFQKNRDRDILKFFDVTLEYDVPSGSQDRSAAPAAASLLKFFVSRLDGTGGGNQAIKNFKVPLTTSSHHIPTMIEKF